MKPEELMIGDYIMFNKDIYIIEEMSKKGWAHIIYNDGSKCRVALSSDYILDEITPVPLTPEILKKNFPSTTDWYFIGTDKFCFRIDKYKDKWDLYFGRDGKGTNLQIKISYVHELQHAMRLCGVEKKIEI